jgi:alanyl-tRNA synthetase
MPDLLVSYPGGATAERTPVLALTRTPTAVLFAVARTPCHPESPRWPDQPADRCALQLDDAAVAVECHEGSLKSGGNGDGNGGGELSLQAPEPDSGAVGCVVHHAPADLDIELGQEVTLSVDEDYRELLSRSHSRCHLVTLALNHALADAWRKDPGRHDSLGSPDFDALAILSSKIDERGSLDTYRIGKHMRKSGFPAEALSDTEQLTQLVTDTAREWLRSRPAIAVTPGVSTLEERRTWSCELAQGTASFPCGGTHARELTPEEDFTVQLAWDPEARQLTMDVRSTAA